MSSIRSLIRCALVVAEIGVCAPLALAVGIPSIDSVEELPALSLGSDAGLLEMARNRTVYQTRVRLTAETLARPRNAVAGTGCPGSGSSNDNSSRDDHDRTDTHGSGSSGSSGSHDSRDTSTVHSASLNTQASDTVDRSFDRDDRSVSTGVPDGASANNSCDTGPSGGDSHRGSGLSSEGSHGGDFRSDHPSERHPSCGSWNHNCDDSSSDRPPPWRSHRPSGEPPATQAPATVAPLPVVKSSTVSVPAVESPVAPLPATEPSPDPVPVVKPPTALVPVAEARAVSVDSSTLFWWARLAIVTLTLFGIGLLTLLVLRTVRYRHQQTEIGTKIRAIARAVFHVDIEVIEPQTDHSPSCIVRIEPHTDRGTQILEEVHQ